MTTTKVIKPILVAIDFSADSEEALLWACNYAKLIKAPVIILHVIHDPADTPCFYRNEEDDWAEPMVAGASRMAEEFMKKMHDKHPTLSPLREARLEFVPGLPPGRIVECAEKEQAQIIVLGSSGRSGLSHVLLGSVAERVARLSKVPVVIVKTPVEEKETDE